MSGNDISTSPLYLSLNFSLSFPYPSLSRLHILYIGSEKARILGGLSRQTPAIGLRNDRDEDPQRNSIKTVPERFLRGTHARGAENDQGTCGTHVHELGQKHAFGVGVDPADQHAHGNHSPGKREEKGIPIRT